MSMHEPDDSRAAGERSRKGREMAEAWECKQINRQIRTKRRGRVSDIENKYFNLSGPALAKFVGECEELGLPLSEHQLALARYAIADAYQDGIIEGLRLADATLKERMCQ